jgi:hypothetical protein
MCTISSCEISEDSRKCKFSVSPGLWIAISRRAPGLRAGARTRTLVQEIKVLTPSNP